MQEITLSFHGLDSRDQVQVVGLGDKYLDSHDPSHSSRCSESLLLHYVSMGRGNETHDAQW